LLVHNLASGQVPAAKIVETQRLIFNDRLDAAVTIVFAGMALLIFLESARHWLLYALGRRVRALNEAPIVLSQLEA
jgi:hypothetical protein